MYKNIPTKETTKKELELLEQQLPHGAKKLIAELSGDGVATKTVDRFFKGTWNDDVYEGLCEYVRRLEDEQEERNQKVQNLNANLKAVIAA